MSVTNRWRLRGAYGLFALPVGLGNHHPPTMGIPVDSGPPGAIIADPDGNPISIHSMA